MRRTVTAVDVTEANDISGRKYINVIGMEKDELIAVTYNLTSRYMIPHEKLMLATVSPEDQVMVEINESNDPIDLIIGEYVGNLFDAQHRQPLCKCGATLSSDGLDIYCPNRECGLTILARLQRLADCKFFAVEKWHFSFDGMTNYSSEMNEQPFSIVLGNRIWNRQGWNLERILLDSGTSHVTLATFLVQDLFRSFLDSNGSWIDGNDAEIRSLNKFYQMMDQIVYYRDYSSAIQNVFIKHLMWSFSIPGLTEATIDKMIVAEESFGLLDEVLLPYANYLTNPMALQDDLGVDRQTADWICREFYIRRHEFFDIFTAYSTSTDMIQLFNNLNRSKRNLEETFSLICTG
jgi:hypothetical protein